MEVVQVAVVLFFIMFIYSGINKILKFGDKVATLGKKTGTSTHYKCVGYGWCYWIRVDWFSLVDNVFYEE